MWPEMNHHHLDSESPQRREFRYLPGWSGKKS